MFVFKTLIRDTLVNNATIKGLFNATATGSCMVRMAELQVSATYPQILIEYIGGPTIANMDGERGRLYLRVESKGSGTEHPLKNLGYFRGAILNVLDDVTLSGTSVCYLLMKTNETGERFDDEQKCYFNTIGFDVFLKQDFTKP